MTAHRPLTAAAAALFIVLAVRDPGAADGGSGVPPQPHSSTRSGSFQATSRNDHRTIVHVLNRLCFGPRAGDVARVRQIGLEAYIDRQLHPERIPDDGMTARLAGFTTLGRSTQELAADYFIPALLERREQQRRGAQDGTTAGADGTGIPEARPRLTATMRGQRTVLAELAQQKLLRAVYSERQLQEVLVDFWFNHFNVFAGKGPTRIYLTEYERDAIRPRVLGRFRDLLGAVAESPAMLFYLDNWQSAAPATTRGQHRRPRGLNENYARELLELHTLGVDGGYTQQDVQEVARAFTGWTIDGPRRGGGFRFEPRMHDTRPKIVLGHRIDAGGKRDGDRVLDILAAHPATARSIATKLARRFVADDPPADLVDRAAARFAATGGDIREVVRTIVTSPEFFAGAVYRVKVKTPLEFVVSAVRATGVEVASALPLAQAVRELGMPVYGCQPPTGYPDESEAWVNTGALLTRMNFALALAAGRVRSNRGSASRPTSVSDVRAQLVGDALANDVSGATASTIAQAATSPQAVALILGSPEFQKR
jgi:uncharacterized protein (DUF1800 family)